MPKLQKTTNGQSNGHPNGPMNGNAVNGEMQPAPRPSLAAHRQVHPMQAKMAPMNGQPMDAQQYYSNYSNGPANALYAKQQQLALHLNAQQQIANNVPQQNGNNSSQQFHPTHKRSRPLSILYKPSPVITTQPENV